MGRFEGDEIGSVGRDVVVESGGDSVRSRVKEVS